MTIRAVGALARKPAILGVLGLFFLTILASPVAGTVSTGRLIESPAPGPGAMIVRVGLYVRKIYDFDPTTDSFQCTFDLWLSWTVPDGNDTAIDPTKSMRFSNAIDIGGSVLSPAVDEPVTADNQSFSMLYHANSRLGKNFDMVGFPVDQHSMDIVIEDTVHRSTVIAYVPDDSQSGFDAEFRIPGWTVEKLTTKAAVHDYGSSLGIFPTGSTFPAAVFSVTINRGSFLVAWQLLPLMFLLALSWLALAINPERADSRLALCATALLTAVFLQQAALSLFNRTYLVLLDNIYIMAYVIFIVNFGIVLVDEYHFSAGEAAEAADREDEAEAEQEMQSMQDEAQRLIVNLEPPVQNMAPIDGLHPIIPMDSINTAYRSGDLRAYAGRSTDFRSGDLSTFQMAIQRTGSKALNAEPVHVPYFPPLDHPEGHGLKLGELFDLSGTCGTTEVVRRIRIRDLILLCLEVAGTIITVAVLCATAPPGTNSMAEPS